MVRMVPFTISLCYPKPLRGIYTSFRGITEAQLYKAFQESVAFRWNYDGTKMIKESDNTICFPTDNGDIVVRWNPNELWNQKVHDFYKNILCSEEEQKYLDRVCNNIKNKKIDFVCKKCGRAHTVKFDDYFDMGIGLGTKKIMGWEHLPALVETSNDILCPSCSVKWEG